MFKLGVLLLCFFHLILFSVAIPRVEAQSETDSSETDEQTEEEHYHESALRRFEIITLSSLPFTAIHSYLVMRGARMLQQNKFSPELTTGDYQIIGIGAASFSLFIGLWDWLHTRHADRSAPRIPEPHVQPPAEDTVPVEETLSRLSQTRPPIVRRSSLQNSLNQWANQPPPSFVMPLIQIRF